MHPTPSTPASDPNAAAPDFRSDPAGGGGPAYTPGMLREYAPEIDGQFDPTYRRIDAGLGFFNEGVGFGLTGLISPTDAARLVHCWNTHAGLKSALQSIVEFCDDPNGSERPESLADGLARLLPAARAILAAEPAR